VSPAEVARLANALASLAVDSVPGAGHFLHEEQPQAVVAAVRRVLTP
jgi:pimeloyl-ACP methyl ester carboxylesterase